MKPVFRAVVVVDVKAVVVVVALVEKSWQVLEDPLFSEGDIF